jgi:hypothetical protein
MIFVAQSIEGFGGKFRGKESSWKTEALMEGLDKNGC